MSKSILILLYSVIGMVLFFNTMWIVLPLSIFGLWMIEILMGVYRWLKQSNKIKD